MKRKILSLILVFAMTVSLLTVGTGAVEPTYGDTAGHWAESSIERWSGHGIIQGSNGLFDPNGQLTCAQLATILAKLLKLPVAKDAVKYFLDGESKIAGDFVCERKRRGVFAHLDRGDGLARRAHGVGKLGLAELLRSPEFADTAPHGLPSSADCD